VVNVSIVNKLGMKMNPIVIDDFLSKQSQDDLEDLLLSSRIQWQHFNTAVYNEGDSPTGIFDVNEPTNDSHQMRHLFIDNNMFTSEWLDVNRGGEILDELFDRFEQVTGEYVVYTQRIKSNMLFSGQDVILQPPHVDGSTHDKDGVPVSVGKKTLIYYVMDSDGDTVLYNEKYVGEPIGLLSKQMTVTPKKGRALIFDSNQLHAGSYPTENKVRVVLNCVIKTSTEKPDFGNKNE